MTGSYTAGHYCLAKTKSRQTHPSRSLTGRGGTRRDIMDRLIREANPPTGQLASPKPQYKKPGVDEYEPVEGQHGAPFATLKDASGNIVSPATEDKLEQVRQLLAGVATEAKLEQARVLLNTISNKDFATQATLEVVQSELALIKSELEAIKANQISGDQKVRLSGTIVEYETAVNAESLPAGGSRIIDWNITDEDLILVAVNIDKAPWSLTSRTMFYAQSESGTLR